MEEFFKEKIGPLNAEVEFSERCTNVAGMEYGVAYQLFWVLSGPRWAGINQAIRILTLWNLKCIHVFTELVSQIIHLCHVSADDALEEAFSEKLCLSSSHLVSDEIEFITVQQFKSLGHVVTLLDMCITVHEEAIGLC